MAGGKKVNKSQRRFIARNRTGMSEAELADRLGLDIKMVRATIAGMDKGAAARRKLEAGTARPSTAGRRSAGWTALCLLIIIAVSVVSYINSFDAELIYDNKQIILNNRLVTDPEKTAEIWTTDYWADAAGMSGNLYRPLTVFSYYVNYRLLGGGEDPAGYHVVNLVLHAVNGVLVFLFLLALVRKRLIALFAGLLFVAHPIQTEAVTNVIGRADLFAMMFTLAALLLHMKGAEPARRNRMAFYIPAAFAFLLGLLSKENAIVMIAVALVLDVMFIRPKYKAAMRRTSFFRWLGPHALKCYPLYGAVVVGWLVVRSLVAREAFPSFTFPVNNPLEAAPFWPREFTAVIVLGLYLWRLVLPVTLSADYSYDQIPVAYSALDWRFPAALAAIIALGVVAAMCRQRSRPVTFFILFFFIAIAPVSNVFILTGTIAAERLLYMPSLAWCAAAAIGVFALFNRLSRGRGLVRTVAPCVLLGIVAGLYVPRTLARNRDWRDMPLLWEATCRASPHSVKAMHNYAQVLYREREYDRAEILLRECIRLAPRIIRSYGALGSMLMDKGDALEAAAGRTGNSDEEAMLLRERNATYRSAYDVLMQGMKQHEERHRRAREYFRAHGIDESKVRRPELWWSLYIPLSKACRRMAEVHEYEGSPGKAREMLSRAADYCKAVIPHELTRARNHTELARVFLARAGAAGPYEKRRKYLSDAAVSALRAVIVKPDYGPGWRIVSYCEAELETQLAVVDNRGGRRLNGKAHEVRHAVRSLIMLHLAVGQEKWARYRAARVTARFGVPEGELMPLFERPHSIEDPRTWSGE